MSCFQDVYDCIVVGLGGHGSAAIANLAKDGLKVIGFEQFGRVHENGRTGIRTSNVMLNNCDLSGSSHGRSRIYRQAYFEDPKCSQTHCKLFLLISS